MQIFCVQILGTCLDLEKRSSMYIFEKKGKHSNQDLLVPVTTHASVCVDD